MMTLKHALQVRQGFQLEMNNSYEIGRVYYSLRDYDNEKYGKVLISQVYIGNTDAGLLMFQDVVSFLTVGNALSLSTEDRSKSVVSIEVCEPMSVTTIDLNDIIETL
jgi:hypothetical protein